MLKSQIAERVDRYQLRGVLGEGAMGRVYLAFDPKFNREVALKTMKETVVEDERIRRWFHREARAMAQLQHPGIVEVHDYSGAEAKAPFLVMERLHGHTLTDVVNDRGVLPGLVLADIAIQLGAALQHAHDAGLVHRDLKPDNIFLEPSGRVVITDFGLARAQLNVDLGASLASAGTSVVGTPLYLAPETIHDPKAAGPTSDIYAVGVVLYFCATLELPFTGEDPFQALSRILAGTHRKVHELQPQLPRAVADAIERTFAFDPARRPQSGQQLSEFFTTAVGLASGSPVDTHGALGQFLQSSPKLAEYSEATSIGAPTKARATAEQVTQAGTAQRTVSGVYAPTAQTQFASAKTRVGSVADTQPAPLVDTEPDPAQLANSPRPTNVEVRATLPTLGPRSSATHVLNLHKVHGTQPTEQKRRGTLLLVTAVIVAAAFGTAWLVLHGNAPEPSQPSAEGASALPVQPTLAGGTAASSGPTPSGLAPSGVAADALPPPTDLPDIQKLPPEPVLNHDPEPQKSPPRDPRKHEPRKVDLGPPGTLKVMTGSVYADIFIKGEKLGSTPFKAQISLPPGKHSIRLVSPDFGEQQHEVVIQSGIVTPLKTSFQK